MNETRISPAGFARLRETLLETEIIGYGPDACAAAALNSVGLSLCAHTFVVDPALDGPIYPFMEWPAELAVNRRSSANGV